ncbi:MAG: adenylate/guanylate cyclase domain-containing protein [Bdellovibrionales bacterium]|jgi:adenylate cyclase|nr:adenylate/guanylate cyclase domain-containing protein [Bdellovibrionales bacterium]MBT3525279.1 adenylate/guanylate cyclase domain-containing protein [Bdellovibrionales bacterium]MBT7668585.1 adenylate/guanylate cyclase domain-containing protein [Bdellovibrionales bacterium]MBT7767430.1 adenylate/guanylate cyclase domain-containing protein [Bdellovibrionales bacterium]
MLTKFIRVIGLIVIVLFCAISIFISLAERDLSDPYLRELLSYPSFFEDRFFDQRMKLTMNPDKMEDRLVLAKIDDQTLAKVGRWPFTRLRWAEFIRKMNDYGAKVLAFDVFFFEPEEVCNQISPDQHFAAAIREFQQKPGNRIILPYSVSDNNDPSSNFAEIPEVMFDFILNTQQAEGINLKRSFIGKNVFPIPVLYNTSAGLAHIEATDDADGIFRHYPVVSNVDELYFPSFSLMAYQAFTGNKIILEMIHEGNYVLDNGQNSKLFLNYKGESKVRWMGKRRQYPEVSVYDILQAATDDPEMIKVFKDKVVFIGSTAFGAHDLRHTPVDAMLPGIFFHINMTNMLLDSYFYKSPADSTMISWIILLGGTFLIIIIQLFGHAIWDLLALVTIVGGLFYFDTYLLTPMGYEIKLFFCLLSIISCYSWSTLLNFYLASKDKNFLKSAFGSYISPELIDDMYRSGVPPKLGGESGILSAYFTDIQGFSSFSEKLSATQLVELLNEYLTVMTDILLEDKGTLDKYEGDAIIAFFGAPMPVPTHATNACRVAIDMQNALIELRKKWVSEGDKWPKIVHQMRMRIGINSGEIVTGNMGSRDRMNYTMMGDAVNLAARLESAAKQYGIYSMISDATRQMAGDSFVVRKLDIIQVVGKNEPVTTYELIGVVGKTQQVDLDLVEHFHQGLEHYYQQKWEQAMEQFGLALTLEHQRDPQGKEQGKINPSALYLERCEQFKQQPPPTDWDGVYRLTSK